MYINNLIFMHSNNNKNYTVGLPTIINIALKEVKSTTYTPNWST